MAESDPDQRRLEQLLETERAALARARRGVETTAAIAQAVSDETDLDAVLASIAERARALVDARAVAILLADGDRLSQAAGAGELDGAGLCIPLDDPDVRETLATRRPLRLDRLGDDRLRPTRGRLPPNARAAILAPLAFRGEASGALLALDRATAADGPVFGDGDERLLAALASSAATAVAIAQTVAAHRLHDSLTAAEEERKRWSRELHDETLQGLGALQVMLSAALRADDPLPHIARASDHLAQEIERLQALIAQLRPASLDQLGLAAAIEHLVHRTAEVAELAIDCDISLPGRGGDGSGRLAPEVESTVYRVVQEALNNARKHSHPRRISVRVAEAGGWITAEIADDGSGFDPGTVDRGFGLVGMAERLALVGGRVEIDTVPGTGTTVRAVAPIGGAPGGSPAGGRD